MRLRVVLPGIKLALWRRIEVTTAATLAGRPGDLGWTERRLRNLEQLSTPE